MLYFITHAYFIFYHTITTIFLRRFWTSYFFQKTSKIIQFLLNIFLIFSMAYFTAFMEAFTISSVPYYSVIDRNKFYLIGSAFYGIYFYVSFPMFYRLDENYRWTVSETIRDSLAAAMLVTIFLDFWRLLLGDIVNNKEINISLPWL
jgi:cycloeucalenol cycloisomerase